MQLIDVIIAVQILFFIIYRIKRQIWNKQLSTLPTNDTYIECDIEEGEISLIPEPKLAQKESLRTGRFFKPIPGEGSRRAGRSDYDITKPRMVTYNTNTVMSVVVSLTILVASIYIILSSKYDEGTQKWAFGVIGSIIGFWFK